MNNKTDDDLQMDKIICALSSVWLFGTFIIKKTVLTDPPFHLPPSKKKFIQLWSIMMAVICITDSIAVVSLAGVDITNVRIVEYISFLLSFILMSILSCVLLIKALTNFNKVAADIELSETTVNIEKNVIHNADIGDGGSDSDENEIKVYKV
jgi:tellurite resistance protein TehA-like permease